MISEELEKMKKDELEKSLKKRVAETTRLVYNKLGISSEGANVSVRYDPETILVTPRLKFKGSMEPEDIVKVKIEDGSVIGAGTPAAETSTHIAIYKKRPDVNAVVHAHLPLATAIHSAGYEMKNMNQEFVVFVKDPVTLDFVHPAKVPEAVGEAITKSNVVIIKNHGVFAAGRNLDRAFLAMEVLEVAARYILAQKIIGRINLFTPEQVEEIKEYYKL